MLNFACVDCDMWLICLSICLFSRYVWYVSHRSIYVSGSSVLRRENCCAFERTRFAFIPLHVIRHIVLRCPLCFGSCAERCNAIWHKWTKERKIKYIFTRSIVFLCFLWLFLCCPWYLHQQRQCPVVFLMTQPRVQQTEGLLIEKTVLWTSVLFFFHSSNNTNLYLNLLGPALGSAPRTLPLLHSIQYPSRYWRKGRNWRWRNSSCFFRWRWTCQSCYRYDRKHT